MSVQCLGHVLKSGPRPGDLDRDGVPYTTPRARALRAVLITIADVANTDGLHAHPGNEAMCSGSLYGRRQVQRVVADLIAEGWISIESGGGGRGMATTYRVHMEKIPAGRSKGCRDGAVSETAPFSNEDPDEPVETAPFSGDSGEDDPEQTAPFCDANRAILEETAPSHPSPPGPEQPPTVYTTSDTTEEPPNPPKSGGGESDHDRAVIAVFAAWCDALGKPHAQLDRARRRPIEVAIRSHGLIDAMDAVQGIRLDEWAVKIGKTEPKHALGNAGVIEKYRDMHRERRNDRPRSNSDQRDGLQLGTSLRLEGAPVDELEDVIADMTAEYQQAAREAFHRKDSAA